MTFKMTGRNEMTDDATGVTVVARGFSESWQKSFGFCDPRSDARSMDGNEFFFFTGDMIGGVAAMHDRGKPFRGYRFNQAMIGSALRPYHKGKPDKFAFALSSIDEAVRLYLQRHFNVVQPTVEFV